MGAGRRVERVGSAKDRSRYAVLREAMVSGSSSRVLQTALAGALLFGLSPSAASARTDATGSAMAERGVEAAPRAGVRYAQAATTPSTNGGASDVIELQTIEVTGERRGALPEPYAGGQVARGGSLGILGTRDALNTPFSTVNFTSKLIQDQQARTAADILINDSSVRFTTASNGFSDTFYQLSD